MTPARRKASPAALQMKIRTVHSWIGMLIAPTVLFMSFTGILQIYNLHEAHPGYTPPPLLEKFGLLHKDQMFVAPPHFPPPGFRLPPGFRPPGMGERGRPGLREGRPFGEGGGFGERRRPKPAVGVLKVFLAAAAVGLILQVLLGLWMALRDKQRRVANILFLAVGTAVPVALAVLTA